MLEQILVFIGSIEPAWIYLILFLFAFIENIFPPSPSDVVVVVGASLIASTTMGFLPVLFITSIGSSLGFVLMYYVGKILGEKILRTGKLKFINAEDLNKTDAWFKKYGFKLILANRFLPGTRSVISFFSGVYELDIRKTFIAASVSAFAWNFVIVKLGMLLGNNVELIDYYLSAYSKIIIALTILVVIIILLRVYFKKRKNENVQKD